MSTFLKWALLADLVAIWCEKAIGNWITIFPLAGDHFMQLAILVIFAVILDEINRLWK